MYILCLPGRNGEECFWDDQCLSPQLCDDEICTCPLNTAYATHNFAGVVASEKCIPNDRKFFFAHDMITDDIMITHIRLLM